MNLSKQFLLVVLTLTTSLSMPFLVAKENRVAVKSTASPEFSQRRSGDGSKIQTYHVIEGKFFGGNTDDKSMDGITFIDIAENMAENLKRQNFYSETDNSKGDLLIMVHYGATDYDADYSELMGIDSLDDLGFGADTEGLEEGEAEQAFAADYAAIQSFNEGNEMNKIFKAKILGLEELYNDSANDQQVYEFQDMVNEERYFIYLVAFDLPAMRKGEKKVMWTTRYSMRAIGQPFEEAIEQLNIVAGNYFGLNMKGLQSRRASDKFEVKMGDIEVISNEEFSTPE